MKYEKISDIQYTFLKGGYYRFDLNEELIFLSLNTVYYSVRNSNDFATGDE